MSTDKDEFDASHRKSPLELLDIMDGLITADNLKIKEQIEQLRMNIIARQRIQLEDEMFRRDLEE